MAITPQQLALKIYNSNKKVLVETRLLEKLIDSEIEKASENGVTIKEFYFPISSIPSSILSDEEKKVVREFGLNHREITPALYEIRDLYEAAGWEKAEFRMHNGEMCIILIMHAH
ncbi:hypothetical protein ACFL24_02310 [Patescibacteria group bacterium]